jgi:signal transduction histidine kinase/CheY-like chemotaxis protein
VDEDPESIPFLSTAPASRRDRRVALGLILLSLAGLAAVLPFIQDPWPIMVAFVPADDTGLCLIYMITAALLIGQFVQVRRRSLIVLSSGYMFVCFVVIAHLLSYAEVLRALRPDTANEQTTTWLFVLWHGIFPLYVLTYALMTGRDVDRPIAKSQVVGTIAAGVGAAVAMTAAWIWIAIRWGHRLPALIRGGDYSDMVTTGVSPSVGLIGLLALVTLYIRTRARRVLDLWLCVVLFAWLLDTLIGGVINQTRFTFGWYAGRIYSLVAASIVLSAMLVETGQLYARLTRALHDMRLQSAALSKSEAALRQAQKMETIGQITGGVAHDFNNLLTVVIGSLDLLKRQPSMDERSTRLAGFAMEAAVRGERLTKQLLAFSRRQVLHPQTVCIDRLIRDFEGLLARAVGGGVRVVLNLAAAEALARVDPAQFEAAMLNLAVNSRDAMNGVGTITIETRPIWIDRGSIEAGSRDMRPGPHIVVAVVDTGSGMDQETLAHVFEPFFTTKPVGLGSGLGLSQVYGFINSADGHVVIESTPAAGTTVRLYFPRVAGEEAATKASAVGEAPAAEGHGETILVVEDDPAVLAVTAETLRELGYVVDGAADAAVALRRLQVNPGIDLMFSDIVMPGGMNGLELARAARRLNPDLKILLTSGYAAGALAGESSPPPGVDILGKPYRQEELTRTLRQLLDAGR